MDRLRRAGAAWAAAAVLLAGCSHGHHWVNRKFAHGTSWIRFDGDGHFSMNLGGQFAATGTYEIDGEDIHLRLVYGGTHGARREGHLEGRTFTDWFGTRYREVPRSPSEQ